MTKLFNYNQTLWVELTPSYSLSGGVYTYTYDLNNITSDKTIEEFILTLPGTVPVSGLGSITGPSGWQGMLRLGFNQVDWYNDTGSSILPGHTGTFTFTSTFGPSTEAIAGAACQNAVGLSGSTFSPVPEPGSLVAFATGLIGLIGLKLRRR